MLKQRANGREEKTVFDDRHLPKTEANAWVAMQVDAANLLVVLVEDLKVLIQPN